MKFGEFIPKNFNKYFPKDCIMKCGRDFISKSVLSMDTETEPVGPEEVAVEPEALEEPAQ